MKTSSHPTSTSNMWTTDILEQSILDFKQVVAEAAESRSNLVHGNVVALHSSIHNRFVRLMDDGCVDGKQEAGPKDADKIPLDWDSERFLVVQRGASLFAFYSICHERYLMASSYDIRAGPQRSLTDPIDESEIFDVHTHEDTKTLRGDVKVSLFSAAPIERFVRMYPDGHMAVEAPKAEGWERFEVVLLMASEASTIAYESSVLTLADAADKEVLSYQVL